MARHRSLGEKLEFAEYYIKYGDRQTTAERFGSDAQTQCGNGCQAGGK